MLSFLLKTDADEAIAAIGERFSIKKRGRNRRLVRYYDSFDWRCRSAGATLSHQNGRLALRRIADDGEIASEKTPAPDAPFAPKDLPQGELRRRLAEILDVRVALPLFARTRGGERYDVRNDDEKIVAKAIVEERRVSLNPVRGYERELDRAADALRALGAEPAPEEDFDALAKAAGLEPGGYDSKVRLRLRPDDPARVSVVAILRRLAEHARANEEGTVADLDPEFLHDYRVSLRRTRAALSQLKTVFRPEEIDRFRSGFKKLGDLTNPARDLDVFLLDRDAYRGRLPERLAPGLARLFDRSEKERAAAKRKIARRLESAAHRRFFDSWLLFLERPFPEDAPEDARLPTVGYASRKIRRRYRNALKIGEAMIAEGPGPAMHRLRLECKKLRYLLEFFRSLYPKKKIGALVARLKALQDALGVYNDLLVQEERMSELLADVRNDDAETAAAIGAMLAAAHQRQAGAVRDYEREFARFAAKKTRAGFADLFRQPKTSAEASV